MLPLAQPKRNASVASSPSHKMLLACKAKPAIKYTQTPSRWPEPCADPLSGSGTLTHPSYSATVPCSSNIHLYSCDGRHESNSLASHSLPYLREDIVRLSCQATAATPGNVAPEFGGAQSPCWRSSLFCSAKEAPATCRWSLDLSHQKKVQNLKP